MYRRVVEALIIDARDVFNRRRCRPRRRRRPSTCRPTFRRYTGVVDRNIAIRSRRCHRLRRAIHVVFGQNPPQTVTPRTKLPEVELELWLELKLWLGDGVSGGSCLGCCCPGGGIVLDLIQE